MFHSSSPLQRLLDAPMRPGTVTWLGIRPARHAPPAPVAVLRLDPATGIEGDHYTGRSFTRQVTLIGADQLAAIAGFLGRNHVAPEELRRNVVVEGINLHALKERCVRLGTAVLQITGDCHPCSRMEGALGQGGYNAVRGHGGLTARVLAGGEVRLGDALARLDGDGPQPAPAPSPGQRLLL